MSAHTEAGKSPACSHRVPRWGVFLTFVGLQAGAEGQGGSGQTCFSQSSYFSLSSSTEFSPFAVHLLQVLTILHESSGIGHLWGRSSATTLILRGEVAGGWAAGLAAQQNHALSQGHCLSVALSCLPLQELLTGPATVPGCHHVAKLSFFPSWTSPG